MAALKTSYIYKDSWRDTEERHNKKLSPEKSFKCLIIVESAT